jgi:hypothetical protein
MVAALSQGRRGSVVRVMWIATAASVSTASGAAQASGTTVVSSANREPLS